MLGFLGRNPWTAIAVGLYGLGWAFVLTWFASGSASYPASCGAANGGLVLLTLMVTFLFMLALGSLSLLNKGQKRKDYALFLGVVLAPALYFLSALI